MKFYRAENFILDCSKFRKLNNRKYWKDHFFGPAAAFYAAEPWNKVTSRNVLQIEAFGRSCVVEMRSDCIWIALVLWKNVEEWITLTMFE